jgi:hypothetical protein
MAERKKYNSKYSKISEEAKKEIIKEKTKKWKEEHKDEPEELSMCKICGKAYKNIKKHNNTDYHKRREANDLKFTSSNKYQSGFCKVCKVECSNLADHRKSAKHKANENKPKVEIINDVPVIKNDIDLLDTTKWGNGVSKLVLEHIAGLKEGII